MTQANKRVLVDGFYTAYRSFFAFKDIKTSDGRPSGLLFGFVRTLTYLTKRFPGAEIIVCWDSPKTWRKEAYSGYKANRTHVHGSSDKGQLYAASSFVRNVGLQQAVMPGWEADDLIGSLIDPQRLNVIFSRDRDFCQLVKDGTVEVFSPKSGDVEEIIYTEAVVKERFGVEPRKLLLYRVLKGDTSDNLPGLVRFPSKKIIELVEKHDTLDSMFASPGVTLTEHQTTALTNFREQAAINLRLMKIVTDLEVRVVPGHFNRAQAEAVLNEFELKSLRSSIDTFLEQEEEGLAGFFT